MQFHPEKCEVLCIKWNSTPQHHDYHLNGHQLKHVTSAKYLGVTITSDLRWSSHINNITNKANRTLGFLRRNLKINNPELKTTAYNTLVRPSVEFASTVWDPYTQKDIHKVEMVQRRAARYTLNRHHNTSSVTSMLHQLGWTSLQDRRKQQRLTMLYKIQNDLVAIDKDQYLQPITRSTRHTHPQAFKIPHSTTDYHLHSFFPQTIRDWNALPPETITAPSLNVFKSRLVGLSTVRKV